jgi:hypothetical protein
MGAANPRAAQIWVIWHADNRRTYTTAADKYPAVWRVSLVADVGSFRGL